MQHVDEGRLHAYLDGALEAYPPGEAASVRDHLDRCEACRERLREAQVVRDAAHGILAQVAPVGGDVPSLEELRRRARSDVADGTRRGLDRWTRLGWAASVVLALGVGWAVRGPGIGTRVEAEGRAASGNAGRGAPPPASGEVELDELAGQDVQASAPGPDFAEPVSPGTPPSAAAPVFQDESVGQASVEVPEAARRDRSAVVADDGSRLTDLGKTLKPSPLALDSVGPAGDGRVRTAQAAGATAADRDAAGRVLSPPSAALEPSANLVRVIASEARRNAPLTAPVPTEAVGAAGSFAASTEGEGSLAVPGLEVLAVTTVDLDNGAQAVRVLQLLPGGDTLDVVWVPAGSDPGHLPPGPEDGRTRWVVPDRDGWLILRARAEPGELEALADALIARR